MVPQPLPVAVLLVSDDERVRQGLQRPLERSGEVAVVAAAKIDDDIAALVGKFSPDVILLDVHPHDDGALTLCRRLSQHAPVLLLSAYLTKNEWEDARAAGASDFHLKRIGVSDLVEKVGSVRARRRPRPG